LIKKAVFIISIDLGILLGEGGKDSERAIESLIKLFKLYNIPATWAVVGCLFEEYPMTMENIVKKIIHGTGGQEIAYHSFTHINFSQRGRIYAEREIKEGLKIAKRLGISFNSFVFPHNAIGHLDVLKENRFTIYRGKDVKRVNEKQHLISRIAYRGIDHLISEPVSPKWCDGIWEIPASMHFYDPLLPHTLLIRAKFGVNKAIASKSVFHIWLHPQDLIMDYNLLNKLDSFLNFVVKKRDEGEIQPYNMADLGLMLNKDLPYSR